MLRSTTEHLPDHEVIDALPAQVAAAHYIDGQCAAIRAVGSATANIDTAAQAMARAVRGNGKIHYAAAGSSGLMALADACELPGTFGIPAAKIHIHMAGGIPADGNMVNKAEDDDEAAASVAQQLTSSDVVIVLSASGTTPYAVEIAKASRAKGATIIAIANNPETTLLKCADIPILVATPAEIVAGSTRLGAGTSQKVTLNLMSTLMAVKLGHVYKGRMVNVVADNAKLERRARSIVAQCAEVTEEAAAAALSQSGGDTKSAILIAAGCAPDVTHGLLAQHDGHLEPCLISVQSNQKQSV